MDVNNTLQSRLSTTEYQTEIVDFTDSYTLFELFEATVDKHPLLPALVSTEVTINYLQLDHLSNQLAHLLRQRNIGVGDFVGIYLDRSIKQIISVLAVLKSGAAYIPLDPSYPNDRIQYIQNTTKMSLMISEQELISEEHNYLCSTLQFDNLSMLDSYSTDRLSRLETGVKTDDLCYILFTSGTTGFPKGIMTEHRNVFSFVQSFNQVMNINIEDRIYQGFALTFDGSVEEIWMALSNGATLVIGNSIAAKLPEEAHRIMSELSVTIFSTVPTFLGLIQKDISSLRTIIISGERCPSSLIDIWSTPKRRILNVYGPTETTVNTTAKECFPGKEITIGYPLDGYHTHILDEQLKPVPVGEYGELYISGVGVARGYYKQDHLTQSAFIENNLDNFSDKLYRTRDQVYLLPNGELQFVGRLDTQVKIRGFRIELSEIESVLKEASPVKNALVNTVTRSDGHLELAAFVIPHNSEEFDYDGVLTLLKARLPAYMIPSYLDLIDNFPRLTSGKASRKELPVPIRPFISNIQKIKEPQNSIEKKVIAACQQIFKLEVISTDADFFMDLGGDSLASVELASLLRDKYALNISIRDIYNYQILEKIARQVKVEQFSDNKENKIAKTVGSKENFNALPTWERYFTTASQALFIIFFTFYPLLLLGITIWIILGFIEGTVSFSTLLTIAISTSLFGYPVHLLSCIALKWIIIGKYKKGKYPLWGMYYLRWWMAERIQASTGSSGLIGTPLYCLYLRMLGAKVGKNTTINSANLGCFDLLQIGDCCSIGSATQITGSRIEDGMLIIDGCKIGDNCFVGDSCCLALNTQMAENSNLEDLSLLPDNMKTKEGHSYLGSPAVCGEVPLPDVKFDHLKARPILYSILHLFALELIAIIFFLLSLPVIAIILAGFLYAGIPGLLIALVLDSIIGVVIFCFGIALVRKLIMPQTPTGIFNIHSLFYLRKWMMDKIFGASVVILHSLYTTIYLPSWLRLMGAKIGRLAEISTISKMTPDLVNIGAGSFFADGSMIGGLRLYKGHVLLKENKIGKRSFVGNNAHLSVGKSLGNNCLLGVLSTAPSDHSTTPDNSEWLGVPSFALPHRKKITSFDISKTFNPTLKLYIQRSLIDGMRILIPNFLALSSGVAFIAFFINAIQLWGVKIALCLSPLVGIALAFFVAMCVVGLKKILMGTFKPVIKPLWHVYVWCNELINGVYETVGAPIIKVFLGTPFFNWYLRLLGCKIGKHSYIGTTLFSEWDLVEIGDYVALNSGVVIQNHLFEDRIMKSSYIKIGDECSVGNMSVVLYDSHVKEKTKIGPLSLVMKGDTLPPSGIWQGIPVDELNNFRSTCKTE